MKTGSPSAVRNAYGNGRHANDSEALWPHRTSSAGACTHTHTHSAHNYAGHGEFFHCIAPFTRDARLTAGYSIHRRPTVTFN